MKFVRSTWEHGMRLYDKFKDPLIFVNVYSMIYPYFEIESKIDNKNNLVKMNKLAVDYVRVIKRVDFKENIDEKKSALFRYRQRIMKKLQPLINNARAGILPLIYAKTEYEEVPIKVTKYPRKICFVESEDYKN